MKRSFWLLLLAGVLSTSTIASAATVPLGASRDTTIYLGNQTNSNGSGAGMYVGTDGGGAASIKRGLMAFDLQGSVPSGAIIQSATLTLTLAQVAGGGGGGGTDFTPRAISLHRVLADWGESASGAGTTQVSGTGSGFSAAVGDATWNARFYSASSPTLWNNPGGDFASQASSSLSIGNPGNATTAFTWPSTPELVADVQHWLDHPDENFGWALLNENESAARTFRAFYTREFSNPDFRPLLMVSYVIVPEPAAWQILMFGALGFGIITRRRWWRSPAFTPGN